jgi:hypothetical protein
MRQHKPRLNLLFPSQVSSTHSALPLEQSHLPLRHLEHLLAAQSDYLIGSAVTL